MKISLKASLMLLAAVLYLVGGILFIEQARAELSEFSGVGNATPAEWLGHYLSLDDKTAADAELDAWIDGWIDGVISVYAFEQVLDQEGIINLEACVAKTSPSKMRRMLLGFAADPDFNRYQTSWILFEGVKLICPEVFGEYLYKEDTDEQSQS